MSHDGAASAQRLHHNFYTFDSAETVVFQQAKSRNQRRLRAAAATPSAID